MRLAKTAGDKIGDDARSAFAFIISNKLRFVLDLRTTCRSWQCDQYSSWRLSPGRISS